MTNKSIGTLEALQAELRRTAKRGYATNFGESEPEISGVAVALEGPEPYALAVSEPSSRLAPARVKVLVDEIGKTVRLLGDASAIGR